MYMHLECIYILNLKGDGDLMIPMFSLDLLCTCGIHIQIVYMGFMQFTSAKCKSKGQAKPV